jgi:phenylacetate-CoA ligase
MHILADTVITEVVDRNGKSVAPGETGEIVVTDLYSEDAPFLRYATGDMAALASHPCSCGRALPLFERIEGRSNDSIVTADGRLINSLALVYPLREIQGIEHYRICQKSVDEFVVQLITAPGYRTEDEERIRSGWTQLLRSRPRVSFEYVTSLPTDASGKFRHVVCEAPAGQLSIGRVAR